MRTATEALKRDPKSFAALGTRAYCLVRMRRAGEALQDLDLALEIRPIGQLYAARAEAKAQLGDSAGARRDADAAVRQDPDLRGPLTSILEAQ